MPLLDHAAPEPSPAAVAPPGAAAQADAARLFAGSGEMVARCRAFDWASTPLGPVDTWPQSLRTLAQVVLAARQPMFLWWGPELIQLYNDGYRPSLGADRHPAALGAEGRGFWADVWPLIGPQIEAVLRGASTWHEDHLVPILRNGRLEDVYWTYGYTPARDDTGAVAGVLVTAIETTPEVHGRSAREAALEAARAEAEAANRAKSEFLATMSHEIRTPINAIQGYAQLLDLGVAGPIGDVQRDYLGRLTTASQHLLGLVNDVLDLSKVDAGEMTVAREPGMTGVVVCAALDLVRPQGTARRVQLVDGNPAESTPYVGDEHRVRQILVNLFSNAVKFTEPGGTVTVTCALVPDAPPAAQVHGAGPWAAIRVEDTGVGIAPEDQALVFNPFHQVEHGHTRTKGGTGLGLAISRRLARLMGGDLTLESTPAAGSTFTLWLPAVGGLASGEDGRTETAADRSARAVRGPGGRDAPTVVRGLEELGALLRQHIDAVLAAYVERLRAEPGAPLARGMRTPELEGHLVTFLTDLAQSLVIVGEAGDATSALLADSAAISATIAERHAIRRFAQGWDEASLRCDYAVVREVLARMVRAEARAGGADVEEALGVLLGFVERAEARSVATWRALASAGWGDPWVSAAS